MQWVKCRQNLWDCTAYDENGYCQALNDTQFNRQCPFYKSRKGKGNEQHYSNGTPYGSPGTENN